ncbi:MAG: topoisomerase subunit, partial [Pseudomonadota bacterium]
LASGTRILHYVAGHGDLLLLLANSSGYGFACKLGDMVSRTKSGKNFMSLEDEETLLPPRILNAQHTLLACIGGPGLDATRLLVFARDELKTLSSGGRGTMLIKLEAKEQLHLLQPIPAKGVVVAGIGRGNKPQEITVSNSALVSYTGKRGGKGRALESKIKVERLLPIEAKVNEGKSE